MKLLYTDIRTSLTEILTREAEGLVAAGKQGCKILAKQGRLSYTGSCY